MCECKENAKFAKSSEQNFSTDIFQIVKVIPRTPCPVYELEDLNKTDRWVILPISWTLFKIDKIIWTRVRRGTKEHKVRWLGYGPDFDSWIKASTIKKI